MINRLAVPLAFILLTLMAGMAFFSMKQDALTFDELAHIPAGYSYLTQQDYRLNPEHPPLAKDLAALPLFFLTSTSLRKAPTGSKRQKRPRGGCSLIWERNFSIGRARLTARQGTTPNRLFFGPASP